jgi:hypothetical protein
VSSKITELSSKIDTTSEQHIEKLTNGLDGVSRHIESKLTKSETCDCTELSNKIDTTYGYCRTGSPHFLSSSHHQIAEV